MAAGAQFDLDFGLGETADAIRETTARFARDRIELIAAEVDATNTFPRALWPQMGALGLHGITVAEADGGLGLGYLEHCVAMEEVSRASASATAPTPIFASTRSGAGVPKIKNGVTSPR
jgi:isovaleryl-CoA dehydrogenase